ncbi:hypothetical protein EK21DRAFT_95200 [Setomelanomma holmii]|uniref:Uncharacterized protein n=1 Tax=Setomelanomma holmii TaxID=210430 RepID=A0A9P4GXQ9_9PLEO|nr:hypothetical protein EK21DRAFT_95200 [Setomelanomma holmii]
MAPTSQQPRPCYFLAPTRTSSPEGSIRLGSIIASPELVDDPISTTSPASPDAASVTTYTERNWSKSVTTELNSGRIGIWASFLQVIVGVGGDVGVSWANEASQTYSAKVMKWTEFRPSLAYIKNAVEDEEVDEFIRGNKFREKVYMVTGVMVASGASGVIRSMRERGIYAHVGVDGTALSGEFSDADDFVFAFRMRQIKVRKTGDITHKAKVDGALFGAEDGDEELRRQKAEEDAIGVTVEGLNDGDADDGDFGMEGTVVDAVDIDGQDCLCVEVEE